MTASILDPQQEWIKQAIAALRKKGTMDPDAFPMSGVNPRYLWFRNPTNRHSLRLSATGWKHWKIHGDFVFHTVELAGTVTGRQLLQLEKLFTAPYYLKGDLNICLISEQDAIMLQLHAGNLGQYLDNLQM